MTQEERNTQSLTKILDAAIREFGEYGYYESSLNRICRAGNISKGRLYHYFPDKEALFYACVYKAYDDFKNFMELYRPNPSATIEQNFHDYFQHRQYFFFLNPYYPQILFSSLKWSNPPEDPTGQVHHHIQQYYTCTDRLIYRIFELYSSYLVPDRTLAVEVVRVAINRIQFDFGFPAWDPKNPSEKLMAENLERFDRLINLLLYGALKRQL